MHKKSFSSYIDADLFKRLKLISVVNDSSLTNEIQVAIAEYVDRHEAGAKTADTYEQRP